MGVVKKGVNSPVQGCTNIAIAGMQRSVDVQGCIKPNGWVTKQ